MINTSRVMIISIINDIQSRRRHNFIWI